MSDFLDKFKNEQPQVHQNEEDISEDESYIKQKKKKFIIRTSLISFAGLLLIVSLFIWFSLVKVPNFDEKSLSDVKAWGAENKINLNIQDEYDDNILENKVIKQAVNPGSFLFKNGNLEVIVSKGADPEQILTLPILKGANIETFNEWADENKYDNVQIIDVNDNKKAKGTILTYSILDDDANLDNFKRKNTLALKVSSGAKQANKNIEIPSFKGMEVEDVKLWTIENNALVDYYYESSNKVEKDIVLRQSISEGKKISNNQRITVYVSSGKFIKVPNFKNISKEDAQNYNGLKVKVTMVYSDSLNFGKFIKQTIKPGTNVQAGKSITVTYSEGKPYIDDLVGKSVKQVEAYFYNINKKDAHLRYGLCYIKSDDEKIPKGSVLKASKQNQYAYFNEKIEIGLRGDKTTCNF